MYHQITADFPDETWVPKFCKECLKQLRDSIPYY